MKKKKKTVFIAKVLRLKVINGSQIFKESKRMFKATDQNQAVFRAFWHYRNAPWQILSIQVEDLLPF